jgi:hypothetical protein
MRYGMRRMMINWNGCARKWLWSLWSCCHAVFLDGLGESMKTLRLTVLQPGLEKAAS